MTGRVTTRMNQPRWTAEERARNMKMCNSIKAINDRSSRFGRVKREKLSWISREWTI